MAIHAPKGREGGAAGIVTNYAEGLEKRGHQVTCLFQEDLLEKQNRTGRFVELRFASRLASHIVAHRNAYSVVNLQAPSGFLYGFRRRFLAMPGPPYVTTQPGLQENLIYAMKREARKGRAWHFAWQNRAWHRLYSMPLFDLSVRTADAVNCYCRDVWTMLRLKYDFDDDRIAFVPNGVAERFFIQREYHHARPLRMLYSGTWLDQRGIFYLREALPRVFAQRPELRFTFAGPGVAPEEIRRFFGEAVAARLDILEKVPWEKMPGIYAEHDILVFPSLLEGQPCVILEAMASGMPVITAETCGMVDVIEDGKNGLLIPPADSAALAGAILHLCESAELRERIGHAARARMMGRTWEQAACRLENLFERTIQRTQGQKTC
jgi:glycosyltransferase involved in cell wall biosynthesis